MHPGSMMAMECWHLELPQTHHHLETITGLLQHAMFHAMFQIIYALCLCNFYILCFTKEVLNM